MRTQGASQRGIGKLTVLVFGSMIAVGLYAGFNILPFYYYFFELQNHMDRVVRVAQTDTDAEIRKKLLDHIHDMQLPVEDQDLKVNRNEDEGIIKVSLAYQEVFYVTWRGKDRNIHTFHFFAHSEAKYR